MLATAVIIFFNFDIRVARAQHMMSRGLLNNESKLSQTKQDIITWLKLELPLIAQGEI
jgi:hypothetical protein